MGVATGRRRDPVGQRAGPADDPTIDLAHDDVAVGGAGPGGRGGEEEVARPGDERDLGAVVGDRRLRRTLVGRDRTITRVGVLATDERDHALGQVDAVHLRRAHPAARRQGRVTGEFGRHGREGDELAVARDRRCLGAPLGRRAVESRHQTDGRVGVGLGAIPHVHLRRGEAAVDRAGGPRGVRVGRHGIAREHHEPAVVAEVGLALPEVPERGVGRFERGAGDERVAQGVAERHTQVDDRDREQRILALASLVCERDHGARLRDRRWVGRVDPVERTRVAVGRRPGGHELEVAQVTTVALGQHHAVHVPPRAGVVVTKQVVGHLGEERHHASVTADDGADALARRDLVASGAQLDGLGPELRAVAQPDGARTAAAVGGLALVHDPSAVVGHRREGADDRRVGEPGGGLGGRGGARTVGGLRHRAEARGRSDDDGQREDPAPSDHLLVLPVPGPTRRRSPAMCPMFRCVYELGQQGTQRRKHSVSASTTPGSE